MRQTGATQQRLTHGRSLLFSHAVPGIPAFLTVSDPGLDSLTLEWGPPKDQNGRLTGYTLTYQPGMTSGH